MRYFSQLTLTLFLILGASGAAASCDSGEIVVKFSYSGSSNSSRGLSSARLAERVNSEMDGRMCLEVFPNATLYNDGQVIAALLQGDVQLAAPVSSLLTDYNGNLRLLDLPFLFENEYHLGAFFETDEGRKLFDPLSDRGLKALAYWHYGSMQLSADVPLDHPSNLKGMKFRSSSAEAVLGLLENLGASSQKVPFSDVYSMLQGGGLDGQESTWSDLLSRRLYEVQNVGTESNHRQVGFVLITSSDFLDSLAPDVREQFSGIVSDVTMERNGEVILQNEVARDKILNEGLSIQDISSDQRQIWIESSQPVWQSYEALIGSDLLEAAKSTTSPCPKPKVSKCPTPVGFGAIDF